jgi:hypothetical protein
MNDLQKQEIYDQLYEGYRVYKSDSALFLLEKYANRNQSELKARDQAALNLPPSWELWDVQRGYRHSCKNPGNRSPRFLLCCKPRAI